MADSLHYTLEKFRDSILSSVAKLEFEIRHSPHQMNVEHRYQDTRSETSFAACKESQVYPEPQTRILEEQYEYLVQKVEFLETTLKQVLHAFHTNSNQQPIIDVETPVEDLLSVGPPQNTRNIVVNSIKNTPALSAAVAAAIPPSVDLNTNSSNVVEEEDVEVEEEEEDVEVEEEEEDVEVEEEEEEVEVEEEEEEVEVEEEEEEEEVEVEEEEEVEVEEEEEEIEVEEFEYKGHVYQRDSNNNVYLDDEVIGYWNGKRILPLKASAA